MAGWELETVYVGLAGPHIKSFNSRGVTSILTRMREINRDDVRRAIETARAIALSPDRKIIHILPQEFTVDDQSDRKSTRLNSSHGYISYAVFCLKKKQTK